MVLDDPLLYLSPAEEPRAFMAADSSTEYTPNHFTPEATQFWAGSNYVGQEAAMTYAAWWAGLTTLCEMLSVFPLKVMRQEDSGTMVWADQHPTNWVTHKAVNSWMTPSNWKSVVMCHLIMGGNSVNVVSRNYRGQCTGLEAILPVNTRFAVNGSTRLPLYMIRYMPLSDGGNMYYENGFPSTQWETLSHEEVLHIRPFGTDGRIGRSVLSQARNDVGLGLTMERYTNRTFERGRVPGFISKQGRLTDKDRQIIRQQWEEMHEGVNNAYKVGILHGGMDLKQVGYTNDDAQLLQNRGFGVNGVSRWLHLHPHMLGDFSDGKDMSTEQLMLYLIEVSLLPWITRIEDEMNIRLFTPREQHKYSVRFDLDALLRGDSLSRKKINEMEIRNGERTLDEIRAASYLAPYPDGIGADPLIIASQLDYLKNVKEGRSKLQGGGKSEVSGSAPKSA